MTRWTRREFLKTLGALSGLGAGLAAHAPAAALERPLIGAIRWDAWNENDEGGWLVPTLKAGGGIDTARVEAVGRMIRAWK